MLCCLTDLIICFPSFSGAPMVHVPFGRIEGMSSRRGAVVFLKDILDEARDKMLQCMMSKSSEYGHDQSFDVRVVGILE